MLLISCSSEDTEYPFEKLLCQENVTEEASSRYRLVVPSDCSAVLRNAAETFGTSLEQTTGVSFEVVYDKAEILSGETGILEILLGKVDRPGVASLVQKLKKDDYICQFIQGRLFLGGVHEDATVAAMERFCREILPSASATCLMSAEGGFAYVAEVGQEKLFLNGFELNEYTVVYPASLVSLAKTLQEQIARQSGYWLALAEARQDDGVGRKLMLQLTEGSALACITPTENGMVLSSDSMFGVSFAIREFCGFLFADDTAPVSDITLSLPYTAPYPSASYRVATVQASHRYPFQNPKDVTGLVTPLLRESADVMVFGNIAERDAEYIADSLSGYTALDIPSAAAYYRRISVTVKESATDSLQMSILQIGENDSGVILVHISGTVSEEQTVSLPEWLAHTNLPVAVVTHLTGNGGRVSFGGASAQTLLLAWCHTYDAGASSHVVSCYVNGDTVQVTGGTAHDAIGYFDFVLERTSVYS